MAAEDMWGPNLGSLKGKTTRREGGHIPNMQQVIPPETLEKCKEVTMAMDIMFVNKLAFLVTISRSLKFGTVECPQTRHLDQVLDAVKRRQELHAKRSFKLFTMHSDLEFDELTTPLTVLGITLLCVPQAEHVPEAERSTRTIQNRVRSTWTMLPFRSIPNRMIIEIVEGNGMWLNTFPPNDGVSTTISPRTLIVGL